MVVEFMDRAQGPTVDFFCSKPSCDLTLKQTCLMRGHLFRGWGPYGGLAPGVTCAMVTHGLRSLSYGHHGLRPCSIHLGEGTVSMGLATGPIYTCETTGHAPVGVLDAHPERHRGTVKANLGQSAPNPMRCVSSCCQPRLSTPLDGSK